MLWEGEGGQPLSRVYSQVSAMVEQTSASPCFLLLTDVSLHGQTTSVCPSVADGHTGCLQLLETIHNAIVHSVHGNVLLSVASCLSLAAKRNSSEVSSDPRWPCTALYRHHTEQSVATAWPLRAGTYHSSLWFLLGSLGAAMSTDLSTNWGPVQFHCRKTVPTTPHLCPPAATALLPCS